MPCDLFIFCGEPSGDLHAESLLAELKVKKPTLNIFGVAGPRMRHQGVNPVLAMEELQVMGFIDVFCAFPKLVRMFYKVANAILELQPKMVFTIDYPGFSLRLHRHLKRRGFKGQIVHFICPSVWAWGKHRIAFMEKHLDHLFTILPFESQIFRKLPTQYVGHPLNFRIQSYNYQNLDLPKDKQIIALFPGSRSKEIERNLPIYLDTCKHLCANNPHLHIALSVAQPKFHSQILFILQKKNWNYPITFVPSTHSYELMQKTHLAIAKSGTVTLELVLHFVPTVVTYGLSKLDLIIARDLLRIRLPFYCLVNIIANQEIFPELIGPYFTNTSLLSHAYHLLENHPVYQEKCKHILTLLGRANAAKEVSKQICLMLSN
ncbi:Lipid-A-disaccharide synthase [Candidatus Rhabdochlamydia oedothoracis]|uniref:Lipid-A-disaccharide synthase n=1 Tax=Candidatus Rhabdochlamydia oedothoracis TaxID=2720720 RepID=A0ABX8V1P6_9BACT|nr:MULTISPECIES: lipid-A-disaccharide synthase [Rhabdochlamydia]KAG6559218.1 Lipid-A-disaccharide synthase [Candidatus Rhabdochlamydia sp. W815]MCL6756428.1 lipid-A-disaccharide synthase [Candidatus Rhabdochlamydia oedothoracis]QYF48427.1 Lipid-A-disaccharide synthase [Candidatus Rhabdochlamydia oedothoracis]